jgi:hypothetical protein
LAIHCDITQHSTHALMVLLPTPAPTDAQQTPSIARDGNTLKMTALDVSFLALDGTTIATISSIQSAIASATSTATAAQTSITSASSGFGTTCTQGSYMIGVNTDGTPR